MKSSRLPLLVPLCLAIALALTTASCKGNKPTPPPPPTEAPSPPSSPSPVPQPTAAPTPTAVEPPPPTEAVALAADRGQPAAAAVSPLPAAFSEPLPARCDWGHVVVAKQATVVRTQPDLQPGPLFSTSGAFAEKPVDEPCDPGQELGPFPVSAGGSLVAHLTGSPPAPNKWSLHNYGTALSIVFEPLLGENNYGPGQEVVAFTIPQDETEAEMGGSWPGPGRLRASIGAPWGNGPLTSSCFEQAYTATAEIVEVFGSAPAQTGMTFHNGDTVITEDLWGEILIAGSTDLIGPGSEVEIGLFGPPNQIREGTFDLTTGERPDTWNEIDYQVAAKLQEFQKAGHLLPANTSLVDYDSLTLEAAYKRISEISDPCRAALDLKLYLDAQPQGFHKKVADAGVDIAAIWLLPNDWDVIDGWGKWAFGQLPGVNYISTAQNVLDTWSRIQKEWIPTVAEQKATWTLDAYERYRKNDWSESQIEDEQRMLQQRADEKLEEIKKLRENFEEMVPTLTAATEQEVAEIEAASDARLAKIDEETQAAFEKLKLELAEMPDEDPNQPKIEGRKSLKQLREEEFWQTWRGRRAVETLARGAAVSEVMVPFQLQMQGLANEYEREVTLRLTEIARSQTEREALENYAKPLADNDCPGIEPSDDELEPDPCTGSKLIKMNLKKGAVRVIEKKYGVGGKTIAQTITVNLDRIVHWIWPEGTEYSVDKQGETAVVRVFEGQVTVTSDAGPGLTVAAGQQVTLPDGEISALVPEPARQFAGVPLIDLPLDSNAPEPYGDSGLRATGGTLPADWVWQEPNKDLNGPGDATLEVVDAEMLRVTTPNENDFWGYRADAPRLLHKTTGDFDLEAEMSLDSRGTNFAYSEFMIFTPQTPLGYLRSQMNAGGLGAHYLIMGGGLAQADNLRKLRVVNRPLADAPDIPDVPVRVRLTRRGDQLKTYWSTDGGDTWTLSSRQEVPLPETLWTGWVFKRMAYDGLNDEPAVTTLRDIHLTTAPLGSMPEGDWDVVGQNGTAIAQGAEVLMTLNGSEDTYSQAYSPGSITGDFDLTVHFEAPPVEMQPEQERMIQVAVTSNDGKNHAYLRNAITPDWHRNDADMAVNEGWNRYRYMDTQESSGRVRLVRKEGVLSGYLWQDGDWVLLADWQDGFSDAVYIDLRYQWKTPTPLLQTARFTIERLETEDGLLIGSEENTQATPGSDPMPQPTSVPATPTAEPAPTPALSGKQRLEEGVLFDDFSSPALGWSVRDSESAATGYKDGGYAMLVKQPTYWVLSKVPGDFPNTVVEFDAAVTPGSAGGMYGVICHYKDSENYDFVAVDPESRGVLAGRQTTGAIHLFSGGADGATGQAAKGLAPSVTDSNHVRAICYDDRLELAIGGVTEGKWALDPPGTAGSAALFVYGFKRLGENGYQTLFDNVAATDERPDAASAGSAPTVSTPAAPAPVPACAKAVDPAIAPQWDRNALGCPAAPAQTIWAAVQAFERGLMLWRDDLPLIYTFYDPGGWTRWPDVWSEGVDIPTRGQPPAGLQAPVRGFGFVWGIEDEVFRNLGWARSEESGMCAVLQNFEKGLVITRSEADSCGDNSNPGASGWFGTIEAYTDGSWR